MNRMTLSQEQQILIKGVFHIPQGFNRLYILSVEWHAQVSDLNGLKRSFINSHPVWKLVV